jgi:two-component system, OmpR family, sensor histidine kinase VanS
VPGNRSFLLRAFAPAAAIVLAFLLVFGLLGGWILAGRMLAPLTRITDATRIAATFFIERGSTVRVRQRASRSSC